jgi:hypothetical protein
MKRNVMEHPNRPIIGTKNNVILIVVPRIFYNPVQDNQQMLKGVVSFLLYSSNYPDMFRQLTAVFRG